VDDRVGPGTAKLTDAAIYLPTPPCQQTPVSRLACAADLTTVVKLLADELAISPYR
jgi:hypothetical protein